MSYITSAPRELFKLAQIAGVDIEKWIKDQYAGEKTVRDPEVHKNFYGSVFVLSAYYASGPQYHIFTITGGKAMWALDGEISDYQEVHRWARFIGEKIRLGFTPKDRFDLSGVRDDTMCHCCWMIDLRAKLMNIDGSNVHQACVPYYLGIKKAA